MKTSIFYVFALLLFSTNYQAQVIEQDSLALVDFYQALSGDSWSNNVNWLEGEVGTWNGITVNNQRVQRIELGYNALEGAFPASVAALDSLKYLYLTGNNLTGSLPDFLPQLEALEHVYMNGNAFTGVIPDSYGDFKKLLHLDLGSNQLTGNLPSSITNNTSVTQLLLEGNNLSGSIPADISNLTAIRRLALNGNEFSGEVPPSIADLPNLSEFHVSDNMLEGNISEWMEGLQSMYYIGLRGNNFTGTMHPEYFNPETLQFLDFNETNISGLGDFTEFPVLKRISIGDTRLNFSHININEAILDKLSRYDLKDRLEPDTVYIEAGGSLMIDSDIDGTGTTYTWYKNDEPIEGATGKTLLLDNFAAADEGVYYARGSDYGINIERARITVRLEDPSSVKTVRKKLASVYPNPLKDHIKIDQPDRIYTHYVLYGSQGRVLTGDLMERDVVSFPDVPPGTYMLILKNKDQQEVHTLIKTK